ncbi:hypothetical protein R3P38DRAFT_3265841 [Favolaschia claudopus]|uniref:F-box domain-containing protein n=1 Tax=Favolaschia claudopus TaxID=2862362 RepID=A0AAW0BZ59_9AGAR
MDSAVIMRVLRSNDPPSADDIAQMHLLYQNLLVYRTAGKFPMKRSDSKSMSYGEFLQLLERFPRFVTGLSSPLRRFPPELLSLIFTFCRDDCLEAGYTVCDPRHTLMALGEVCSRWRAVLRSMPGVWNHLHFSTSAMKPCNAEVTQHLLGLSRQLPLSLRFSSVVQVSEDDTSSQDSGHDFDEKVNSEKADVEVGDGTAAVEKGSGVVGVGPPKTLVLRISSREEKMWAVRVFPTLEVARLVADRLEYLHIHATSDDLRFCNFLESRDTTFSILSSLTVTIVDTEFFFQDLLTVFHTAPSLRKLLINDGETVEMSIDDSSRPYHIGEPDFPWNQLTVLTIDIALVVFDAREVLCECEALEVATFSRLIDDPLEERLSLRMAFPTITTLLNVREFSITSEAHYAADILEDMSLPNLESLTIDAWHSDFIPVLGDLEKNSKFNLLHFTLHGYDDNLENVFPFLSQTPSLETLDFQHCNPTNTFYESLTYTAPQSQRSTPLLHLPNLRILTLNPLEIFGPIECPEDFVKLLDSLSHFSGGCDTPCPRLKTLRLSLSAFLAEEGRKIIEEQLAPVCGDSFDLVYC